MSEPSGSARTEVTASGRPLAVVAGITMFFIGLQFVLAGYGIFERQYHKADDGWFEPHQVVGYLTILLSRRTAHPNGPNQLIIHHEW